MPAILQRSNLKDAPSCASCEERAEARLGAPAVVRLSIAHTARPKSSSPLPIPSETFRVWPDASLAMIPAGQNLDPKKRNTVAVRGIRGKIETLSKGARTRIRNYLSMIRRDVTVWTMALTLPARIDHLPPEKVHALWRIVANRISDSVEFSHVGIVYKRELQKRGALHYHLAFFGLRDQSDAIRFQTWLSFLWSRLCCKGMEDPDGKLRSDHLWWHLRFDPKNRKKSNMQRVRTTLASYFAKYLGKAEDAPLVQIPGKWWGKLNEAVIPLSDEKQLKLPIPVIDKARRMASKLQSKRIQHGLFITAMRQCKLMITDSDDQTIPAMTLQEFNSARHYRPPENYLTIQLSPLENRRFCHYEMRKRLIASGYRSGAHNRPRISKYGKITLVGGSMPSVSIRIVKHAAKLWKEEVENHKPF